MSDTHQTRVRYDRAAALLLSTGVTLFALLAGLGVIGTGVGASPAYAERSRSVAPGPYASPDRQRHDSQRHERDRLSVEPQRHAVSEQPGGHPVPEGRRHRRPRRADQRDHRDRDQDRYE